MATKELREIRKLMFAEMEQRQNANRKPEGIYDLRIDKDARRLAAIAIVAGGYGGGRNAIFALKSSKYLVIS